MTERSESERAELVGNLPLQYFDGPDYCTVKDATGGDFALTVQPDLLKMMEDAFRSLAAQDQKPVALAHVRLEDDGLFADLEVLDGTNLQPSMSPVALYLSPPPAPGWDEAIEAACNVCRAAIDGKNSTSHMAAAEEIREQIEALRPSQSTSDAGGGVRETECLMPLSDINDLDDVCRELGIQESHVTPAEAVRELKSEIERLKTALSNPAAADSNASVALQNDLGEMLLALGMSDAAQPKSPHEVFQSAIAEMKRRLANASAEARLRVTTADGFIVETMPSGRITKIIGKVDAHPHASDCEKQGETTTWDMEPNGWVTIRPSDRTADVTEDEIAVVLVDCWHYGKSSLQTARALLDAFEVSRK